jgi:hypothetical protein
LILEVGSNGEMSFYRLPEGDNRYIMKINNTEFTYELIQEGENFKMTLKK